MNEMTNSHILVHEFDYLEPRSVGETIALLDQYGDRAKVLAGGTDLIVQIKMERLKPEVVIGIHRVPGLAGITSPDGVVQIGALTPVRTIYNHAQIQTSYPALAEACHAFSTTQIQYMGTIGGNLCNGSPASDSAPALIAFGAEVVLRGPNGDRRVPVEEFFAGPGRTVLQRGELLTSVTLPTPRPGTGSAFLKISRVEADIAKANAAVVLVRDGERIADCRLAYGSVAPTPFRARGAERMLRGQVFSPELVARVAEAAADEITPIDDVRSNAWYRRRVVNAMTQDGLNIAWQRADGTSYSGLRDPSPEGKTQPLRASSNTQYATRNTQYATRNTQHTTRNTQHKIELTVNGVKHTLWVAPNELLLNVLRDRLELTGTKYACGIGECSACTVRMNGRPTLSCLTLAVAADGSDIVTVEGLQAPDGTLDPLQEAFIENAAFQCGFCTPGMLMTAKTLLEEIPHPGEDDVRDYLKGNLCRCTGYASIVRAVMSVAE